MSKDVTILLVEDDEVDAEFMHLAFQATGVTRTIVVCQDGLAALARLRGEDGHPPLQRPFLLVIDLRMPRMDGIEFLQQLRDDPALADLPAFVLSTSAADRHKREAYALQAAGYFAKRDDLFHMREIADLLNLYCKVVEMP